jgi:phage-related minor tail protein
MAVDEVEILFDVNTGQAVSKLNNFQKNTESVASKIKSNFLGITAAIGGTVIALSQVLKESYEAAKASQQLNNVLKLNGGQAGVTATQVKKLSGELQRVTTFGDDAITSAQSLLVSFGNLSEGVLPKATEAALDLATVLGTDLNSAAQTSATSLHHPFRIS